MRKILILIVLVGLPTYLTAQPETPLAEWTGKTILLIGAHPDDDTYAHWPRFRLTGTRPSSYSSPLEM
jgi:hypothetical protein